MARESQGYMFTLDGWRALAIMAVLVDHVVAYEFHDRHWLFVLTRIGANGVSLFFAISGFLICSRLLEEQSAFGRISLKGFYIRRACRILPAALAYLIFVTLLAFLGYIAVDRHELWATLFFWRNYLPKGWIHRGWGGYTVHYWSLAVEEHFYLMWPILLVVTGRRRARFVAPALALMVAAWRWWDFHHQWFATLLPGVLFAGRTDVRLDGLLIGCAAALWLDDPSWRTRVEQYFTFVPWLLTVVTYMLFTIIARQHLYTVWESALLPLMVVGTALHPGQQGQPDPGISGAALDRKTLLQSLLVAAIVRDREHCWALWLVGKISFKPRADFSLRISELPTDRTSSHPRRPSPCSASDARPDRSDGRP